MSDFEKWFRSLNANEKIVYFLGNEHKVSEMAWNHKQAEVDELQLKNAELARIMLDKNRDIVKQAMQIDELQKRVDGALHILDELYRKGLFKKPTAVSDAIKALRGES